MIFVGLYFSVYGLINNAPGALKVIPDYVVWPLVYIIILTSHRINLLNGGIQRLIIYSTIILSAYGLIHLLADLYVIPEYFAITPFKSETIGVGQYEGYIEMTLPGVNSLPFLIPFCIASLILNLTRNNEINHVKLYWLWVAVLLGLIFSLLTARRAVWLVILLTPFIYIFFNSINKTSFFMKLNIKVKTFLYTLFLFLPILTLVFFFVKSIYDFNIFGIINTFFSGFNISSVNEFERFEQFHSLLNGWADNPLFGSGHGSSAYHYGSVRSNDRPWSYELFYFALLFQVGIIGIIFYASGVIWVYFQGVKIMQDNSGNRYLMLPFIVAMTCMFIAGGTNPVFMRFDGLWFFFIPLALINNIMLFKNAGIKLLISEF